jgi:hypothetical protein
MAVLAVLIPPLMLALVLALGKYEELLLPEKATDRPAPAAAPTASVSGPAAAVAYDSRQPFDAGLPGSDRLLSSSPGTSDARSSRADARWRSGDAWMTYRKLPITQGESVWSTEVPGEPA